MTHAPEDTELLAAVSAHIASTDARVSPMRYQGRTIWVKQREDMGLVRRLQKGSSAKAFQTERAALHQLRAAGAPVPAILAEGPNFFVTEDCGVTLQHLLRHQEGRQDDRCAGFAAAGRALAALHARHLSHGRPAIKDICWQDGRITLLDFERYHPKRNTQTGHAQDLIIFVHSVLSLTHGNCPELGAALKAYRADDLAHIWQAAQSWCRKMRWLDFVTKPVQWFDTGNSREFKAIPLTFAIFAAG